MNPPCKKCGAQPYDYLLPTKVEDGNLYPDLVCGCGEVFGGTVVNADAAVAKLEGDIRLPEGETSLADYVRNHRVT